MAMEKNGNTFAPGDAVLVRHKHEKQASALGAATIETIDVDAGRAQVKLASGQSQWVDMADVERA